MRITRAFLPLTDCDSPWENFGQVYTYVHISPSPLSFSLSLSLSLSLLHRSLHQSVSLPLSRSALPPSLPFLPPCPCDRHVRACVRLRPRPSHARPHGWPAHSPLPRLFEHANDGARALGENTAMTAMATGSESARPT